MCNRKKMTGRNVNPGLTEPLIIIRYTMIIKSPSQKNHLGGGFEQLG